MVPDSAERDGFGEGQPVSAQIYAALREAVVILPRSPDSPLSYKELAAELRAVVQRQRERTNGGDLVTFYQLDDGFNRQLLAASGHGQAWTIIDRAKPQLDRARYLSTSVRNRSSQAVEEHLAVVTTLGSRNLEQATQALRSQLNAALESVETAVTIHSRFFATGSFCQWQPAQGAAGPTRAGGNGAPDSRINSTREEDK